jgi:hypothetical protein
MTDAHPWRNPADDYPPTRPNLATLLIALALVFGVLVLVARSSLGV